MHTTRAKLGMNSLGWHHVSNWDRNRQVGTICRMGTWHEIPFCSIIRRMDSRSCFKRFQADSVFFSELLSLARRQHFEPPHGVWTNAGGTGGGATPLSQAGFKRLVPGKGQQLTLLSVEVQADCRCGRLRRSQLHYGGLSCSTCEEL